MYELTDFSKEKLSLLADMIQSRLRFEQRSAQFNKELPCADHVDAAVIERLDCKFAATITDLKEMNVWVLTSLQIVKEKEIVNAH